MNNNDFPAFNGIGSGARTKTLPNQLQKKTESFKKKTMESLYWEATKQIKRNYIFSDIRRMTKGNFTYRAVDIERTFSSEEPWIEGQFNALNKDVAVSTHLKHFDFIGIIANAITGMYDKMDDLYRVESLDEYSQNEYIRAKTDSFVKLFEAKIEAEKYRILIQEGLDPNKNDFQSEEEAQQYQQQLDQRVQEYLPQKVEKDMSKNFKVLAVEWGNNVLRADKKRFNLDKRDREALIDFILTGRWFRHYKVGYDYYDIERWLPEETFFSQDIDTEYPEDLDYIGKLTRMSINDILQRYGHLMTTTEQEKIGNYWNQTEDKYESSTFVGDGVNYKDVIFPKAVQVPFRNYFDHQINLQMESALGEPLARTMTEDGKVTERHWMPRNTGAFSGVTNSANQTKLLRDDIDIRTDTIEVMDVYWRSMKKVGILIFENEFGQTQVETVTDELLNDFLKENDIKKVKDVHVTVLQKALKENKLEEHINTISYHNIPEIWHGIMIKGDGAIVREDMYIDIKPLEYQIKGNSNLYKVRIPVGGLITDGYVPKILPYQQLHNVCMNQMTELLRDEPGTFYTLDINSLPSEYKDETTEEALFNVLDSIKSTKLLALDPSRSNTQGSTVYPNIFQRNEIVFTNQIQYRRELAEFYKQEGYSQVGVTPQMLGQPNTYITNEGIEQGAQASFALLNNLIEDFNQAKAKANEIHLAIAQFCEVNGKESTKLTRKSDHELAFIDILAEDGEIFPLRNLSIIAANDSKDREIVKTIQNMLINDNTIQKDFGDIIDILTNPYTLELREIGNQMRMRQDKLTQEDRQFQSDQLDKQIAERQQSIKDDREHELLIEKIRGEYKLEEEMINAYGRASLSDDPQQAFDRIQKDTQTAIQNDFTQQQINVKKEDSDRKQKLDAENKKLELEKLKLKREEIKLRREISENQKFNSIINKN